MDFPDLPVFLQTSYSPYSPNFLMPMLVLHYILDNASACFRKGFDKTLSHLQNITGRILKIYSSKQNYYIVIFVFFKKAIISCNFKLTSLKLSRNYPQAMLVYNKI